MTPPSLPNDSTNCGAVPVPVIGPVQVEMPLLPSAASLFQRQRVAGEG